MSALFITLVIYGAVNTAIIVAACIIRATVTAARLPFVAAAAGLQEIRSHQQLAGARQLHEQAYFTGERETVE